MLIAKYSYEKDIEVKQKEAWQEGIQEGQKAGRLNLLYDLSGPAVCKRCGSSGGNDGDYISRTNEAERAIIGIWYKGEKYANRRIQLRKGH